MQTTCELQTKDPTLKFSPLSPQWSGHYENHDPKTIPFLDEHLNMVSKIGIFTVFHPNL